MTSPKMTSHIVRVEGKVPRADQIAVQATSVEDAEAQAVEIAEGEGFTDAKAVSVVPIASQAVVPRR